MESISLQIHKKFDIDFFNINKKPTPEKEF